MTTSQASRISLSFSDAITVLIEATHITPCGRSAFEARMRHLQRLGLPHRTPDERMSRIVYGITEMAALATVIRLMAAFMIPVLAVRYVNESWDQLASFALAGARNAIPAEYLTRRPIGNTTIAIIEGNALADLGQKGRHDERFAGTLGKVTIADPAIDDLPALMGGSALMIDSRAYMPIIVERAAAIAMATDVDLATELDRLRSGKLT